MQDKANIKTSSTQKIDSAKKKQKKESVKEILKTCKTNHNHGPAKIVRIGLEAWSKICQRMLKALEQVNKMFRKYVETWLLKGKDTL